MKENVFVKIKSSRLFSIHPISVIVWLWLLIVLGVPMALSYIFAILIHELGHFSVAKKCGYQLSKFSFSPYGVSLSYLEENLENRDEFWIALAGPLANLVFSLLVVGIWWIFPSVYFFTSSFVEISILLALFNLLPAFPMDGGRIFVAVASHYFSSVLAKKITIFVNIVLSVLFFILFGVFCFVNFNPTYLLFAIFLVVGTLDLKFVSHYEKVNVFCKKQKKISKPNILLISLNVTIGELLKKIETKKNQIFCLVLDNGRVVNLSEKMIVNLSLKFPYDTTLAEIFEK